MTETDAFARLKTRPRATVPARTSSLIEPNNDKKTEISHSSKATVSHSLMTEVSEGQLDRVPDLDVSESSVEITAPERLPQQPSGEVNRRTLRISRDLDAELESLCSKAKITRETFLEAAYLACQHDSNLMESVLERARQRYLQRKQIGERRKFETMQGKFTDRSEILID
jgi:hypothetical protein